MRIIEHASHYMISLAQVPPYELKEVAAKYEALKPELEKQIADSPRSEAEIDTTMLSHSYRITPYDLNIIRAMSQTDEKYKISAGWKTDNGVIVTWLFAKHTCVEATV